MAYSFCRIAANSVAMRNTNARFGSDKFSIDAINVIA
jgi:hypothetical protein